MYPQLILLVLLSTHETSAITHQVYKNVRDLNFVVILKEDCLNSTTPIDETLVNSAIWTTNRLNTVENSLNFGLEIVSTCDENSDYQVLFDWFLKEEFLVGVIKAEDLGTKFEELAQVLEIKTKEIVKWKSPSVFAAVEVLKVLNWKDNITVVAPDEESTKIFSRISRDAGICVQDFISYRNISEICLKNSSNKFVVFGSYLPDLEEISDGSRILFISIDGSLEDFPLNSYVIIDPIPEEEDFIQTPNLFEIAIPMVNYAENIWSFLSEQCNETLYKLNCLHSKFRTIHELYLEPSDVIELLKIEEWRPNFTYDIYKIAQSPTKVFTYNIFDNNLTILTDEEFPSNNESHSEEYFSRCKNSLTKMDNFILLNGQIRIRAESWIFAFLSLSLLGVLFCLAILIFILVSLCRRDILEGNPLMTLFLLFAVMLMYCSILPICLQGTNPTTQESISLARALAITLSFAAAFSLVLSRSILLATASRDLGFMSHVAGPVQSFLCLFIFGVQAALDLQVIGRANDLFKSYSFIYLLSYNVMLLLLLLCLCPLILKSQRNYREGRYFTIAVILISFLWSCWIPLYGLLEDQWKDPVLSFGLVSTASVLLGTIFVPRTYLMTIASARDKLTGALPSLATASSALDIYRSGGHQPVYDCVNVAAINAATVARAGITTLQEPDLYSCPNLPDEDEFDFRCSTPINNDKVTRF